MKKASWNARHNWGSGGIFTGRIALIMCIEEMYQIFKRILITGLLTNFL
jgi:hypothetical protein